jgi:mono/diheme cytochrome c family protein
MSRVLFVSTALWVVVASHAMVAQAPKTVWDGAYTGEQATRGRSLYAADCASCHGSSLEGGEGTALAGKAFWDKWRERSVGDLLSYVSANMPLMAPGSLSPATAADIVAHILKSNDLPTGAQELSSSSGAGVQIVARDGSSELSASTLARVVGCLTGTDANSWRLVKASRPERSPAKTPAAEVPLGDREFALKFVLQSLKSMVGQKVAVTGLLIGDGGADGVNVSSVQSVASACN